LLHIVQGSVQKRKLLQRPFVRTPDIKWENNWRTKNSRHQYHRCFEVPYQPGTLKAVNLENGTETTVFEIKTSNTLKSIRLVADRTTIKANRNDLTYVTVEVMDENNRLVSNAEIPVQFSIEGEGGIAAVGNSNPKDVASFHTNERKTFKGRCLAILRPKGKPGKITLKATAYGLTTGQIIIKIGDRSGM